MPWHRIDTSDGLEPGEKRLARIQDREVLVCRLPDPLQDQYVAIASRCTHAAWPLAGEPIEGNEILCTLHGARFDLRDGCPTGGPASKPLATYPVEVRDGVLYVSL
ncbi:MAG TPA: Rieske 2Fe-2S domain-containing protein [Myxococcota bacterium]|nr:Rieske 2Fe-2S domain-containing protein [Myxococcota bacterium]